MKRIPLRHRIGSWAAFAVAVAGFAVTAALAGEPLDCAAVPVVTNRSQVALHTDFGAIRFELLGEPDEAPETVENFLGYVNRGDYDGMFFHRLATNFVLQGGGFTYDPVNRYQTIPTDPPVDNDYQFCNVRGTVAMAKVGGQPNSATSQFFINLVDNSLTLDEDQNEGFTVFAQVVPADMAIVDQIAALHWEYGPFMIDDLLAGIFETLPVKHVLERPEDGFGTCVTMIDPDPILPPAGPGPTGDETCASQDAFAAAIGVWRESMDPRVPPELVMVTQVVPEPGAVTLLGSGAAALALRRVAGRRRLAASSAEPGSAGSGSRAPAASGSPSSAPSRAPC